MVQVFDHWWFEDSSVKTNLPVLIYKYWQIFMNSDLDLIYTLAPQMMIIPLVNYCESGGSSLFFNLLSSRSIPESFPTAKLWPACKCIQSEWTWFLLQDPGVAFMPPFNQHLLLWAQIKLTLVSRHKTLNLQSNGPVTCSSLLWGAFWAPECTGLLIGSNAMGAS